MNDTITINVPERAKRAFASATHGQRELAWHRFIETLETPEPELYPEEVDVMAIFREVDRRHRENNVKPIEHFDEIMAEYKEDKRKRIAEMGDEAHIAELCSLREGEVYMDDEKDIKVLTDRQFLVERLPAHQWPPRNRDVGEHRERPE